MWNFNKAAKIIYVAGHNGHVSLWLTLEDLTQYSF